MKLNELFHHVAAQILVLAQGLNRNRNDWARV